MTKKRKRKLKAIDLFAGAGGFSLGLQMAGIDIVAAVEIDKWCCDTLKANKASFPKMKIIQADICTLSGEYLLDQVGLAKGKLDMLVGGPPCQGFSTANMQRRSINHPKSKMMWQFIRMVKEIQPRYFVIENVPGLLSFKDFFRLLLRSLEKCGYVVRFNLLDCCSYGVPQHRLRVMIDGARSDLNVVPAYPPPTHFSPEQLGKKKKRKGVYSIPAALVAEKSFATHGFDRSEVDDVWWNNKLGIMMNKKTALVRINQAVDEIIVETLFAAVEGKRCK